MAGPVYHFPQPSQTNEVLTDVTPMMMQSFAMRQQRLAQMQPPEPKLVAPRPGVLKTLNPKK